MMKPALSGRLFESRTGYTLDLEAFLKIARSCKSEGADMDPCEVARRCQAACREFMEAGQ